MERLSSYEADRLNDALYGMDKDGAAQAQVSARYVRTDKDGTPWVRFEGADKDTPLTSAMSVRAREGDLIDVSLGGYEAVGGGNRTDPSAGFQDVRAVTVEVEHIKGKQAEFEKLTAQELEADKARIGQLEADSAEIEELVAQKATITQLEAAEGRISDLESDHVSTTDLTAVNGEITNLKAKDVAIEGNITAATGRIGTIEADYLKAADMQAETARVDNLLAKKATVNDLNAATGRISVLESTKANIADIEANYITADDIEATYMHADMTNSDVAWIQNGVIANGAISSAMINDVSANKLTAGTINGSVINVTNLNADNITAGTINGQRIGTGSLSLDKLSEDVYTESEVDAKLATMQAEIDGAIETWTGTEVPTLNNAPASNWQDAATRDTHVGDVYFVVNSQSQQNGYNYRFTKSGSTYSWQLIKDSDVTNALQRISTAEGKITQFDSDISTLKTDTGTLTTRTTSLETRADGVDSALLDKVDTTDFNELSDTVDGHTQTLSQHTTAISNKADGSTVNALTTRVSKNEQDISGINSTIGELQTTVASKADGSDLTTVSNRLNTVSDTVDGHTQTISSVQSTLATKADGSTVSTLTTRVSDVEQDVSGFKTTVSETYATKSEAKQTDSDSGKREIVTEDAAELPLLTLTAYGECEQDGTPTPDAPVAVQVVEGAQLLSFTPGTTTRNGVTSTISEDGTWTISGTATADVSFYYTPLGTIPIVSGDTVTLSGMPTASYGSSAWRVVLSGSRYFPSPNGTFTSQYSGLFGCHVQIKNGFTMPAGWQAKPMMVRGDTAYPYVPYGSIGIVVGDTATPIDLQGNSLASLPDGTRDELHVDSAGRVWIESISWRSTIASVGTVNTSGNTYYAVITPTDASGKRNWSSAAEFGSQPGTPRAWCSKCTSDGTGIYIARTWNSIYAYAPASLGLTQEDFDKLVGAEFVVKNRIATIDLGYINPPTTFDGGSVYVVAEIQPVIDASWWTAAGYDAGKAYNDGNNQADLNALEQRVTIAESSITQQAGQIAIKANAADVNTKAETTALLEVKANRATLTSEINASADTVKIDADRVNIEGAAIFTSGRLSQSSLDGAYDASGAADTALTNAKSYVDGKGYQTASDVSQAIATGTSNFATKANAVKRTQRIWYRKSASGAPTTPGPWVTNGNSDSSWTKYNAWSTRIPPIAESKAEGATKYLYLYTCEQREMADGTLAYTTVLLDDSTTVIDGGNIITGSVSANKLEAYDATIQKIRADAIDAASITIGQSQVTGLTSTLDGKASTTDVANAAKRTYVSTRATAIDFAADTATLEATLYIDGVATTTGVTYAWLMDGTAISGATSRTYSVPASSGLSHAYSCKATW